MNQKQLLLLGEKKLKQFQTEDAYQKAKQLLTLVMQQKKEERIIHELEEVSTEKQLEYEKLLNELIEGTPLQYLTHQQEFMGLNFYVDENVLIPQPDTEILVETTLHFINNKDLPPIVMNTQNTNTAKKTVKVLDLCTGSGAIAVSIAKYVSNVEVLATDISPKAIEIAKKNAIANQVATKIQFLCSDLWNAIKQEQFDYIVSNPPYIETDTIWQLPKEVRKEPYIALNGGIDGLTFYHAILQKAHIYLKTKGYLLLEIGFQQGEAVKKIGEENAQLLEITPKPIQDFGGNDRVVIFQKK